MTESRSARAQDGLETPAQAGIEALLCHDVWVRFGGAYALTGIRARFERARPRLIRGPNASGKSTLLAVLAGLLRPSQGEVLFFGAGQVQLPRASVKDELAYFGQGNVVYPEMSATDNLLFHARIHGLPDPLEKSRALLEEMGMDWRDEKPCGQMSHGQKRRVGLARALLTDPQILLLDEPDAGLDRASRIHLARVFMSRAPHTVLVVASHDDLLCSHMEAEELNLEQGRITDPRPRGDEAKQEKEGEAKGKAEDTGNGAGTGPVPLRKGGAR